MADSASSLTPGYNPALQLMPQNAALTIPGAGPNSGPGADPGFNSVQGTPIVSPQTLGANTYNQASPYPSINAPIQQASNNIANLAGNQVNAQGAITQDQINGIINNYNDIATHLGLQKKGAGQDYQSQLGLYNSQLAETQGLYGNAANTANTQYSQQQSQAEANYNNARLQNFNIARAQGSQDSSAYGDIQGRTSNAFTNQLGNMMQDHSNTLNEINIKAAGAQREGAIATQALTDKYNLKIQDIDASTIYNDKQKANLVKQTQDEFSKKISDIDMQTSQFMSTLGTAQAQIASQIETAKAYMNALKGNGGAPATVPTTTTTTNNTQPTTPTGASNNNDNNDWLKNITGGIGNALNQFKDFANQGTKPIF